MHMLGLAVLSVWFVVCVSCAGVILLKQTSLLAVWLSVILKIQCAPYVM